MIGETINGRYQLEDIIGSGGMGTVYRAHDLAKKQTVAVKMLNITTDNNDSFSSRFYREFRVLVRLKHPHIVRAYQYGMHQNRPYLVLEYLQGDTVAEHLKEHSPLPRPILLDTARQLVDALMHIHAQGITHRDLKPGNLMLMPGENGRFHLKLMDFGLVHLSELSLHLTQEGSALGTVTYMAPEQAQGLAIDFRADLYALGILLYEMAAGRPPFRHENPATVLLQQITTTPPPPQQFNPSIDTALSDFIMTLLYKDPEQRPASTALVANQIEALANHDQPAGKPITPVKMNLLPRLPLIGREPLMAQMRQHWQTTTHSKGQLILLSGMVGAGKGRIVEELQRQARISPQQAFHGRNREHGSLPYQPFVDILDNLVNQLSAEEQANLPPELTRLLPSIKDIVGESSSQATEAQMRLFAVCWQLLSRAAQEEPRLLIIEDMQWADPATLEMLDYITQRLPQAPLLLILTYRTEEVQTTPQLKAILDDLNRLEHSHMLEVPLLTREQVASFLQIALGQSHLPDPLIDNLYQATGGNPLYIEETIKVLTAEGNIDKWIEQPSTQHQTSVSFRNQLGSILQLPQRVLAIAERRLQLLPSEERSVLATAAVLGPEFSFELLHSILDMDEMQLVEHIDNLLAAHFIEELPLQAHHEEERYRFHQEALRQALLNTLSRRRRRLLHQRTSQAMQSLYDTSQPQIWPILAHHYQEAGDRESALTYFILSGDVARRVYAHAEAIAHYTAALELADIAQASTQQLIHLYSQRGRSLELYGKFSEALTNYEAMQETAVSRADHLLQVVALLAQAILYITPTPVNDGHKGKQFAQQALSLAREHGIEAAEAKALWTLMLRRPDGIRQAIADGEQSIAIARRLHIREQLAYSLNDIYWVYIANGQLDQAQAAAAEARQLWRELDNQPMLSDNLTLSAGSYFLQADFDQALTLAHEAYTVSKAIDNLWGQAFSLWPQEYVWIERGEWGQAMQAMNEAITLSQQAGLLPPQVSTRSDLALIHADLGDFDHALTLNEMASHKAEADLPDWLTYCLAVDVRLYYRQGNLDLAQERVAQLDKATSLSSDNFSFGGYHQGMARLELGLALAQYEAVLNQVELLLTFMQKTAVVAYIPSVLNILGETLLQLGQLDKATTAFNDSQAHTKKTGAKHRVWPALWGLSRIAQQQGQTEKADHLRQQAADILHFIAEHTGSPDLHQKFLARPHLQPILHSHGM